MTQTLPHLCRYCQSPDTCYLPQEDMWQCYSCHTVYRANQDFHPRPDTEKEKFMTDNSADLRHQLRVLVAKIENDILDPRGPFAGDKFSEWREGWALQVKVAKMVIEESEPALD